MELKSKTSTDVENPSYNEEAIASTQHLDERSEGTTDENNYGLLSFFDEYPKAKRIINKFKEINQGINIRKLVWKAIYSLIAISYMAYFLAVLLIYSSVEEDDYWCKGDGFLIVVTCLVGAGLLYFKVIKVMILKRLNSETSSTKFSESKLWNKLSSLVNTRYLRRCVCLIFIMGIVIFLIIDTRDDRLRLMSAFGIVVFIIFGFLFSAAPRKVRWRHVFWGIGLQFVLGLAVLRWPIGKAVFNCLGEKFRIFLFFTDAGSQFVFGELAGEMEIFAFKVLTTILFFGLCIQVLYYYGVMQWVVIKLGWLLQMTVGTTACESVLAAANIFLGQCETPLIVKPYLKLLTKSELHAIMSGGLATVAGALLAAYINFGLSATHLLSAAVMSAPAGLAFAKLFYPEVSISQTSAEDIVIVKSSEVNPLHAALEGVMTAVPLIVNMAANLLAFLAFLSFIDAVLNWTCSLLSYHDVCNLSIIFGYVFMPVAWLLGVAWEDCFTVGQLIGTKTIVNEFVGYIQLSEFVKQHQISKRSEIIATYALCGASNITAVAIIIGALGALIPERKKDLASLGFRALISGSVACFLTACVAGMLISVEDPSAVGLTNSTQIMNSSSIL